MWISSRLHSIERTGRAFARPRFVPLAEASGKFPDFCELEATNFSSSTVRAIGRNCCVFIMDCGRINRRTALDDSGIVARDRVIECFCNEFLPFLISYVS